MYIPLVMIKIDMTYLIVQSKLYKRQWLLLSTFTMLVSTTVMGSTDGTESDITPEPALYTAKQLLDVETTHSDDEDSIGNIKKGIAKIRFIDIKTPENREWKSNSYENLNKELKKIRIKIPKDSPSKDFLPQKNTITAYGLLRKMLYDDAVNLESWPDPIVEALDQALLGFCEDGWKKIKNLGINKILKDFLGDRYYIPYLAKALGHEEATLEPVAEKTGSS